MQFRNSTRSPLHADSRLIAAAVWAAMILSSMASMQGAGTQLLSGHVPEAVAVSKELGPVARSTRMSLAIGLPLRNQAELETFLQQLADPASPNYRQYLTPSQFAERFGPSEEDYQTLAAFMRANGLEVTGTHPNRMILDVGGPVANIESTLHINLMNWHHPARGDYFAPDREPSLDTSVAILHIAGLDNFVTPRPMDLKTLPLSQATPMTSGSGPAGLFIGGDFRAAYAPGVTLNGAGMSVGLFELDGFYASDETANFKQAGLPPVPTQTVLLDGFNGTPGSGNIEVILDIMMASYMAPGLSNVIVYEGYSPDDVMNRMATDNLASQLSSSWGWSPTDATLDQIYKQFIAQGQSMFQASGDGGAYTGAVMPPADDPNITSVGGTSLTTAGAGGAWQSETTWSGSGGGVSTVWPIPSWQQAVNMKAVGGSATMRNLPDVSMIADIQMYLVCNNGQTVSVGGTSAATPLWAGFTALANQQAAANAKPRVGFVNPALYALGATSGYASDLHDIVTGNNGGFSALTGYDLATGWGTPAGQPLINALTGVSSGPAFGLSPSTLSLSIAPGTTGTATITVSPQNGFSGTVNLTASGLPTGVTASFSPAAATTSSALTLTVASSAASGPTTITITGTSGSLTSAVRLTLTVTGPPTFTLTASPASVSVAPGATSTSSIAVNPLYGFNGTVALKVSGLPTGVTAAFSPASTASASTLTFTAASSAALATSTVTVTGTSGSLSITTTISLTVAQAPNYTISATPATLTVAPGGTGVSTIAATPLNGFNGNVNLSLSGMPAGVTPSFTPANAAWSITLNLAVGSSVAAGTYTITITGTSGSLSNTATIKLTVSGTPSFTLAAAPASVTVVQGATGTSTITVTPAGGFSGTVSLAASGLPAGVTASFSGSTLTLRPSASAATGASTITITGTSGSLSSKTTISLTVTAAPGYTLAASPASVTLAPGGSAPSTITVTPLNGFTGTVTFLVSGLPTGVTAAFSPTAATKTSTLTFSASSSAAAGTSTVTVSGASGTATNKTTVALTVTPPPGFALSATPASLSLAQGTSIASAIAISGSGGFAGTVALTATGMPSGVTAAFSPASTATRSTVTFTASATAAVAPWTATITGTSGSLKSTVTIAVTMTAPANFTLTSTPGSVGIAPGTGGASTIAINDQNGFTGTVSLTASGLPTGVTAAFSPASTASKSTVTFTAAGSAPASTSTVTITGTSGSLTNKLTISLVVTGPPTFSLSVSPAALSIAPGASAKSALTLTPQNGFTGSVTVSLSGLPAGVLGSFGPGTTSASLAVTLTVTAAAVPGTSTVTVTGKSGSLTETATIALTVLPAATGTALVNMASVYNVSGIVTDGSIFSNSGGLDAGGRAYSENLLGPVQSVNGQLFSFGSPNAPDAVSSATIPLPAGQFSTLTLLATAVNGAQLSQTFTVTYSDGTTASFKQSLSDWCVPASYAGESKAIPMTYRDNSVGTVDTRPMTVYGYSFSLTRSKTVKSITLPKNVNVVVLAISLKS
jgi:subtilase family serine protease